MYRCSTYVRPHLLHGRLSVAVWCFQEEIVEKFGSGCGSIGFVDVENVSGLSQLRFMAGLRAMKIDSE